MRYEGCGRCCGAEGSSAVLRLADAGTPYRSSMSSVPAGALPVQCLVKAKCPVPRAAELHVTCVAVCRQLRGRRYS